MAQKNKVIQNKITGMSIRCLQTSADTHGQLLEVEATYPGQSTEPPLHFHPEQDETFQILEGELNIRMDGEVKRYQTGDLIFIPRKKIHSMWNSSGNSTVVNWKVEPAMNTEDMMATIAALANNGLTNKKGVPKLLFTVLIIKNYAEVFRLPKPPFAVQKIILWVLVPVAYFFGYTNRIKEINA